MMRGAVRGAVRVEEASAKRAANATAARFGCVALLCTALFGCASRLPAGDAGTSAATSAGTPAGTPAGTSAVPPANATPPAPATGTPPSAYEQQQRDRAWAFTRQKRLADAAMSWELLTVLRPDIADYRERLADVQRQIDAAVTERLPRAAQAAQRGELDNATQLYLATLALQPLNEAAADALRAVERERNRRNHLGKFSRATLTQRAMAEAESPANASAASGGLAGRNDVEHAALLAGDGEIDDAIALLERRLVLEPKDQAARRVLADVYYRKAESLLPRDRRGAVAALQKSARAYPAEPRAANRLKELKSDAPAPAAATPVQASPRPTH